MTRYMSRINMSRYSCPFTYMSTLFTGIELSCSCWVFHGGVRKHQPGTRVGEGGWGGTSLIPRLKIMVSN